MSTGKRSLKQLPPHIAQQGPDEDYDRSLAALRKLAKVVDYNGLRFFGHGLDLSSIAGDGVVMDTLCFTRGFDPNAGKFHYWVHEQPPAEPSGEYHKRFTVTLYTKDEHPTYGASDKSFKLKGLLFYGAFWEWLLE